MRLSSFIQRKRIASVVKPLYGHTDQNSAYVVDDYPYSFNLRTKIRYWLEHNGKKGWRFLSQTLNPKTNAWNKPKASTYSEWAGAMFLDEKGHVTWTGITPYSDVKEYLEFVKHFPQADYSALKQVIPAKIKYLEQVISGERVWTINGVPKPPTEADLERYKQELETWQQIKQHVH